MRRLVFLVLLAICGTIVGEVAAQLPGSRIPPRVEDHFWRRKVISRIDLTEKINEPLIAVENPSIYSNPAMGETNGVIAALVNGLKSGKYLAYDPDSLNKSLTYDDVVAKAKKIEGDFSEDDGWGDDEGGFDDFGGDDDFDFGDDEGFDDFGDDMGDDMGGDDGDIQQASSFDFELSPYESTLEFIEDRIFDKNRSDMVYDIQYIRLVWVDPGETLPDKLFCCFKYDDVLETLEDTQWKNKYNDAEYRNLREIFELRLFNSYILNVSGRGVRTLEESDFRRNQLLEFEHHLWSY